MRNNLKTFVIATLAAFTLLVAAPAAVAQRGMRGMRGMGGMMYLQRKDVQKDLKLTEKQVADLQAMQDKIRTDMQEIFQNAGGDRDAAMKAMQAKMADYQKQVDA